MNDPRRPDPASSDSAATDAASSDAPPASPWWSRPEGDQWGTPTPDAPQPSYGTAPQPSYGTAPQPSYGTAPQPSYGAPYGSGPTDETANQTRPYATQASGASGYEQSRAHGQAPADDPWSQPSTRAGFPSGAQPWGTATDTNGAALTSTPARSRKVGVAALVLATALLSGAVGGVVGARTGGGDSLLDPSASLGSGASSTAAVDRAPDSVAGIAARVMQSTVSISVRGGGQSGTGSGVVIRSDGYILTNNHVVEGGAGGDGQITVTFDGAEKEIPAEIVGLDPVTDLAVIQVKTGEKLPAASLGQSRALVVGDPVIAIGSPLGLSGTVTTGIVSALNRTVNVPGEGGARNPLYNAIQTDAAINPGNSGGALVNAKGEVIGINSAIATLGGGGQGDPGGSIGVGFSIPIDEARSVAEEIIRTGKATHPSIGVSAENASGNADRRGAIVRDLTAGGAAGKVGLEPGDLITKVGKTEITSVDELILAIRSNAVGDTVTLSYVRDGQDRTVDVQLQDLRR